jgi:hypothetical protein
MAFLSIGAAHAAQPVGAAYLKINPSARIAAMGISGAAITDDASSLFLNPAGLALTDKRNLIATHADLSVNDRIDALGYTQATTQGTVGVSALYLSRSPIEGRADDGSQTGSFTAADAAFGVSLARALNQRLNVGFTLKGLQQRIASDSANGVALDAGAQMKIGKSMMGGLALANLGPSMKFISQRYALPTELRGGLGYGIGNLLISVDGTLPVHGGQANMGLGIEFMPFDHLAVRGGYLLGFGSSITNTASANTLNRFSGFGAGLGIELGRYSLDYALVPNVELTPTQILTLSGKF